MSAKKAVLWLAILFVPIIALWSYACIVALRGFDRNCGLMNRGRGCTLWEFIDDQILNAFVAPGLIAASATWLLIVAGTVAVYFLFRNRIAKRTA